MNDQLKDRLFNYEAAPPSSVWDRVFQSLDDGMEPAWVERVKTYGVTPASIWSRILAILDQQQPAKVIPFFVRHSKPIKYSASVAAIFVFVIIVSLLVNKKAVSESAALAPDGTEVADRKKNSNSSATNSPAITDLSGDKSISFTEPAIVNTNVKQRINKLFLLHFIDPPAALRLPVPTTADMPSRNIEWHDAYTSYATSEGTMIRMSKKLFDMVNCAAADIPCQEKLKAVRSKLSSTAMTGNFGGLLEMLNSLSDNP